MESSEFGAHGAYFREGGSKLSGAAAFRANQQNYLDCRRRHLPGDVGGR